MDTLLDQFVLFSTRFDKRVTINTACSSLIVVIDCGYLSLLDQTDGHTVSITKEEADTLLNSRDKEVIEFFQERHSRIIWHELDLPVDNPVAFTPIEAPAEIKVIWNDLYK